MFNKSVSALSAPEQPALQAPSKKRFGKKLYVALIAIAAIAVILGALLIPQSAAIIPLDVKYEIGEKMVYNSVETMTYQEYNTSFSTSQIALLNGTTINMTQTVEVTGSDGEYFTLNHTITTITSILAGSRPPPSFSYLEKINKQGYSTYIFTVGAQTMSANSTPTNPFLTELLNRSEVKVGDTWTVPLNTGNASVGMIGEMTMTFWGFQDLTVEAGTYRVFRVDMASNNAGFKAPTPPPAPSGFNGTYLYSQPSLNLTMSGSMYMEYGTLRPIKSTMQESIFYESATMNYSMSISGNMSLVQHIMP